MNRGLFGACGVLAVVALSVGNCKSDPLSDLDGIPAAVVANFSYLEVPIPDTLPITVAVVDGRSTPLAVPVTFSTCNAIITTAVDPSYHPIPATSARVLVTAVTYGTSCVIAEADGVADTVQISTFPVSVHIIAGPDTVISGVAATAYTHQYRDRAGNPVTGVPAPTWTVNDTTHGTITPAGAVLSGRDTGLVTVIATGVGTLPITGTKDVVVRPAPFDITIIPNPADPGQVVKLVRAASGPIFDANSRVRFGSSVQAFVTGSLTPDSVKVAIPDLAAGGTLSVGAGKLSANDITQSGGVFVVNTPAVLAGTATPSSGLPGTAVIVKRAGADPAFDANTRVFFNGVRTFVSTVVADSIVVPVPGVGAKGAVELRLTRLDASDLARRVTFTADTGVFKFADQYDGANNNPATAPVITANGDYYVVLSGTCANGAGGAGTDCDDFFRITNNGATAAAVTVNAAWLAGPDVDILLGSDPVGLVDFDCDDGCGGATGANPENTSISVPAGATYYFWANMFGNAAQPSTVVRIRVSGLP
jgi:hypothetical protein